MQHEPTNVQPISYAEPGSVKILDQRYLPAKEEYIVCVSGDQIAAAIKEMVLRGAPLISIAAAMGLALEMETRSWRGVEERDEIFHSLAKRLLATRPTAVNLRWAIERMQRLYEVSYRCTDAELRIVLRQESLRIMREDRDMNLAIGQAGERLLKEGDVVLTHCNTGALASGGHGTALGVIRSAVRTGKQIKVLVSETRPYLQGARLTAWELTKEGIDATLITDNMAGHCMQRKMVDAVIVGADRVAMNGDVANKIGTYSLSVLAKEHALPFYVAAPSSTLDPRCFSGRDIAIEERQASEVTHYGSTQVAPEGIAVYNPAFDVTPASHVGAIITERGVLRPPLSKALASLVKDQREQELSA